MIHHYLLFLCMTLGLMMGAYFAHPIMKLAALGLWLHFFFSLLRFREADRAHKIALESLRRLDRTTCTETMEMADKAIDDFKRKVGEL